MGNQVILLDTSVLIEFFRKSNKQKTLFYSLSAKYPQFAVSTITRFEIFVGQNDNQDEFWNKFFDKIKIIDFDDRCAFYAGEIVKQLKRNDKMIEVSDILIASTAIANDFLIATLNTKHFIRIKNLKVAN